MGVNTGSVEALEASNILLALQSYHLVLPSARSHDRMDPRASCSIGRQLAEEVMTYMQIHVIWVNIYLLVQLANL